MTPAPKSKCYSYHPVTIGKNLKALGALPKVKYRITNVEQNSKAEREVFLPIDKRLL